MFSRTIIISCAGMGNRLGLGKTKALIEIEGKPLIIRQLEMLANEDDIRIVVGYQAEQLIDVVKKYRKDVVFVFNHNYRNTGTGASVVLASQYANEYILTLDGDLLIHPDDMKRILKYNDEFVSGGEIVSDDPWFVQTEEEHNRECVRAFSKENGRYEWNGIAQLESYKIREGTGHVFQLLEPWLPIPFLQVRTREIDTKADLDRAEKWIIKGYKD
ncbi:putative uncharacterized protein [Clostridium sp. CAG:590]|nr:putative uncharacterized protein [Clostridium sp. CAG:590]